MIVPKKLKLGDKIGLISPASSSNIEDIDKLKRVLEKLGFKIKLGKHVYKKNQYLAGTDQERVEDIHNMFLDKDIDAILCTRGGYGSPRILDLIDYNLIKENPKIFIGYSDITALHIGFNQRSNLVTYHGPMGISHMINGFNKFSQDSFKNMLMDGKAGSILENPKDEECIIISSGVSEGRIVGGNLSLIVATLGTEYEIDTKGKILLIEEVSEEPRKIDRMINQLRLAGKFDDSVGVILGDFKDCEAKIGSDSFSLLEVIEEYFRELDKAVIYNFQTGHCENMITLPLGIKCRLDANDGRVILLEDGINQGE